MMQSQRASLLEKQEAEIKLLRWTLLKVKQAGINEKFRLLECAKHKQEHINELYDRNDRLEEILHHAAADQRRGNDHLQELVDNYWALLDDCVDVGWETKENSRGQKRKLPATEELKKIRKIISEHNAKRARMVVGAMTGAGSSTDH